MTRPIYEPTPARTDAYLDFQEQQLFRRPAPTSGGARCDIMHMYNWDTDGSRAIPSETWTSICGIGGTDGEFERTFHSSEWTTGWNCNSGNINLAVSAEYLIQGWVQFFDDADDGEQRFVAINFGSSNRHIQEYVANANSGNLLAQHLPVHTFYFGTSATCFIDVWHDNPSSIDFRGAEFSVKRFAFESEGTIEDPC